MFWSHLVCPMTDKESLLLCLFINSHMSSFLLLIYSYWTPLSFFSYLFLEVMFFFLVSNYIELISIQLAQNSSFFFGQRAQNS